MGGREGGREEGWETHTHRERERERERERARVEFARTLSVRASDAVRDTALSFAALSVLASAAATAFFI